MVATRSLQKGVTLNVALARSTFCGFCEVVFRERHSVVVVTHGALSLFTSQPTLGMTESLRRRLQQALIYAYISAVSVATLCLLAFREWDIPAPFPSKFWNAIAAFVILGILSESFSFTIPVANVRTSVSFVPFIASVALFSGVSIREAWDRIGKDALATDLLSSTLAVLLVFLYVKLQLLGLAILVFPLFLVRQLYQMNFQMQLELEEKLELMVKAMEARDPYTSGHSLRVSEYALAIARELRLSANDVDDIKRAALLHDVGKIYEEFAPLLRKEGKLTPEERMTMRTHVTRSAQLVDTATRLRGSVQAMIRHHHENFDGSGYPDGVAGNDIPMGARIIMIADTIDAMTTDRPYRRAMSLSRAIEELETFAGRQFDPQLVKLVSKSTSIRRLLGTDRSVPEPTAETPRVPRPAWAHRIAQ